MGQAENNELATMTETLDNAFADVVRTSVVESGFRHYSELANQSGASLFIGRIDEVRRSRDGYSFVAFAVEADGWFFSSWPEWAFELAKSALLSGKRVLVFSNGDPIGKNLAQVGILAN